jgi:hypothetical protein
MPEELESLLVSVDYVSILGFQIIMQCVYNILFLHFISYSDLDLTFFGLSELPQFEVFLCSFQFLKIFF